MNSWLFPYAGLFKALSQEISPVTTWFSPTFEFDFAGNRRIESEIVSDHASYGCQLGLLTKAVLELAAGQAGEELDKLRELDDRISEVKARHQGRLEDRARTVLDELMKNNSGLLEPILKEYQEKLSAEPQKA